MSANNKDNDRDQVPVNDEMTDVQQWMQKEAHAADFVRTVFPDQMDGLEDGKERERQ